MSAALLAALLAVAAPVPVRLPAEVDDAYALRFNPAGLGRVSGGELRLLAGRRSAFLGAENTDYGLGGYAAIPLFGATTFGLGFEADERDGDFQRTLVTGFGFGRGPVSFGFSYSVLWPFEGNDEGFWSLGAQLRPASWLALGFTTRDVGQRVMDRVYDTGVALRPFSRLKLSARWRYEEREALNDDTLDLAFRGEVEPLSGLVVGAVADLDGRVLVQLGLNLERFSVGGQLEIDDDDFSGTTEVVFRSYRKPSLLPIRRVAVIDLAGELKPDPSFSLFGGGIRAPSYGAVPIYLERLVRDDEVVGVFARIGPLGVGWATVQEVRRGLKRLRDSGRRVDCQLTGTGDKAYLLASVCSTIIIPPPLQLTVNGVQAKLLFLGEALDRYGIEAEVYRRDEFKTGPETFTRSGLSPAQRTSLGTYLDQVQATLVKGIADGRKMPAADVEQLMKRGIVTATEAVDLKMVDRVMYPDEVEAWVRDQYPTRIKLASGEEALQPQRPRYRAPPQIALVHVDAEIASGSSRNLPLGLGRSVGAQTLVAALEAAGRRRSIRAVVLRVDSPGGGAFASDVIARAVRKLAEKKPVIASFGDVAASGGYYVASGAKAIYAEPTTLTGSIGVFSLRFSAENLLRRFGINAERLGPGVGSPSLYLDSTPEERAIAKKGVDASYRQFLNAVAAGRKAAVTEIEKVAGGRIWTGVDAKARGLVDEIGGFVDALKRARAEAGLADNAPVQLVNLTDTITPLPVTVRLAGALGLASVSDVEAGALGAAEVWPEGIRRLMAPLLTTEPSRPGAPPPMAWLPVGLSVD